ncbi:unnamed protein product [Linum tenue]|uniref:WAT1-related protein n=1 Tax=Linum tenue TaxID=586396 RepID=A0AAV0MKD8_9ROSI|nr:unnamed protein product [Linum tenue]
MAAAEWLEKMKPVIAVVMLQVGSAGMDVISKVALNEGMSNYVFVVYRHAVATLLISPFALLLDRSAVPLFFLRTFSSLKTKIKPSLIERLFDCAVRNRGSRPEMTRSIFTKISALGLLEPVINQNLYFLGMKYTTATFAAAIVNILPALTFLMAFIIGKAKVFGTIATVAGAMVMTLIKGPAFEQDVAAGGGSSATVAESHSFMKGGLMMTVGCFSWAGFVILQAITLKEYPADLSLTALICLAGTIEGGIVALLVEWGRPEAWALGWDTKLLAAVYSGVVCSGLLFYIQGIVMRERGPVFVTAFNPLCMVLVAIMSSIFLDEEMFLGRVIGAAIIVAGLYLVVWGKSVDYDNSSATLQENQPLLEERV